MILKVQDQNNLIPTSTFPYATFAFDNFNVAQSRVIEDYDKDINYIASIPTGAGKTVIGEMFISHEISRGKKAIYLAPLRALAQEKIDDWTDKSHSFSNHKLAICTGDYRLTADRKKEMDESNIILATTEMLNSRVRNFRSENNNWLKDIGVLVADESQLLTAKDRGDHMECGLMKFTEINPDCRLVFLSATTPNTDEIGNWLSRLNNKKTIILESKYRPVPLKVHYVKYWDVPFGYDENEQSKIQAAIKILNEHPTDKFIVFVHTKRTGEMLANRLKSLNIKSDFHNADLNKEKRIKIERDFREDPKLRVIIATSGLSQGLNMPARRVIILGVHCGLSEVDVGNCAQMAGRAGRPKYDTQGDAYVLLPARSFEKQKERISEPQKITSQLSSNKTIAFHITSEIHHRNIQSLDDVHDWYERSLANHQNKALNDNVVHEVIKNLSSCGAVYQEDGTYETTAIGNIASMFYYSPFDVANLARNWNKVFKHNKENDDYWVAMALAHIDSHILGIASNADKEEMSKFKQQLQYTDCQEALSKKDFTDGSLKVGCCYYNLLNGRNSMILNGMMRNLQMDFERLSEILCVTDQMSGKWDQRDFFKRLYLRILYGVSDEMVNLCRLKNIGKIKAKRLWDANLKTLEDISTNTLHVIKALSCSKKVAEDICQNAKELLSQK